MSISVDHLQEQFRGMDRLPDDFDIPEESEHLRRLWDEILGTELAEYTDPRPEGVGGSGVVFSAVFTPFRTRRAVKLPRKPIYDADPTVSPAAGVDPELHALSKLSHSHITRLYSSIPLPEGRGYCAITEYVSDPQPLDLYAEISCCSSECRRDPILRESRLVNFARLLYNVADALTYMHHEAKLIHFDIKPDNILVSEDGIAYVTDLGFARDVTQYRSDADVQIGFTWKYAHPVLTDPHRGARISRTANKAKNTLRGADIQPRIDVFAFGRTVQEVLQRVFNVYGEAIHSSYAFNYLHMLAALCLDGKNAAGGGTQREDFVSDQPGGLPLVIFDECKVSNFHDVLIRLERLLGRRRVEDEIPELDPWSASTINVSDLGITTLTPRVKALLDHPLLQRLGREHQLGMLDTIFPTATHTRLQHSLGVYHAACEYIRALYYDPENPTFRVLFDPRLAKTTLLASLLHDVGQTSFGHELEEADPDEFSHETIGAILIEHSNDKDRVGQTIVDLISGDQSHQWDSSSHEVINLLIGKRVTPLHGLMRDILNGQLDADKLDYLIRDSVEARVKYGFGIDTERFLRSLTTVGVPDGRKGEVRLAVKRKGAASAEAFAFARYQLYQSLYWHHTFRAAKGMFLLAVSETLEELRRSAPERDLLHPHPIRDAYLLNVYGFEVVGPRSKARGGLRGELEKRLAAIPPKSGHSKYAEDAALDFFRRLSTGKSRQLLEDLIRRQYYKRLVEIPLTELREEAWVRLRESLKGGGRLDLTGRIREKLIDTCRSAIQDQSETRQSLVVDNYLVRFEEIIGSRHAIVIDLPLRGWMASGEEPIFVSDYKRRHFRNTSAETSVERGSLWSSHLGAMMRQVAVFRVFCDPELHDIFRTVLDSADILTAVREQLP